MPALWRQHAEGACASGHFLQRHGEVSMALLAGHTAMHSAAANGPMDTVYRHKREQFIGLLVDQVRREERPG